MATALVTQIAYAVQTLFDPAGTAGRLVDLGKLANYGLLTSFTPAYLFTTGVNGTWYDPSDLNTLFQDAAGTLPVTAVEQPVGLMLDKSKGLVLGPELVTNGTFDSNINGWSVSPTYPNGTLSWVAGKLRITLSATGWCFAYVNLTGLNTNSRFIVTTTTSSQTTQFAKVIASSGVGGNPGSLGYDSGNLAAPASIRSASIFPASTGSILIGGYGIAGQYVEFDNISVRELPGNHAFNSSGNSANFPVLSARYNLLTKTEQFDAGVWSKNGVITPTATTIVENTSSGEHNVFAAIDSAAAATYTFSVECALSSGTRYAAIQIATNNADNSTGRYTVVVDLSDGAVKSEASGVGTTGKSKSVTSTGSGKWRISVSAAHSSGTVYGVIGMSNSATPTYNASSNPTYTGDGTSGIYIWGADLRVANDALNLPAYQRVNTATDYDTVGFKPYLRFNGTNQWLQTNSIDFSYGDKMFVSAGVRKLSDATNMIAEASNNVDLNNGAFNIAVVTGGALSGGTYISLRGTQLLTLGSNVNTAPATYVHTGRYDISAISDKLINRVNGTQTSASGSSNGGTGNFGNYPLYLGARAGSSLWFNGRLYGMVVAGKQASAAEITSTETYLNQKTGAF